MKKTLFVCLLSLVMMVFSACGGNRDVADNGDPTDGPVEEMEERVMVSMLLELKSDEEHFNRLTVEPDYEGRLLNVVYETMGGDRDVNAEAVIGEEYFDSFEELLPLFVEPGEEGDPRGLGMNFEVLYDNDERIEANAVEYLGNAAEMLADFFEDVVLLFQEEQY